MRAEAPAAHLQDEPVDARLVQRHARSRGLAAAPRYHRDLRLHLLQLAEQALQVRRKRLQSTLR